VHDSGSPATPAPTPEGTFVDDFDILIGTEGNDRLVDTSDINSLYGGKGNDRLIGDANAYSQVDYDGYADEYRRR